MSLALHVYILPIFLDMKVGPMTTLGIFWANSFCRTLSVQLIYPFPSSQFHFEFKIPFHGYSHSHGLWLIKELISVTCFKSGSLSKLIVLIIVSCAWLAEKQLVIFLFTALTNFGTGWSSFDLLGLTDPPTGLQVWQRWWVHS